MNGWRGHHVGLLWLTAGMMLVGSRAVRADFTFGEPMNLGPPVNSPQNDAGWSLSADGLSLYFISDREGGYGLEDIWLSTRATTEEPWGPPENLGPVINTELYEGTVSISPDGRELYFDRGQVVQGPPFDYISETWVAKRANKDAAWGEPEKLGLAVPAGFTLLAASSLSGDGLELYLDAWRFGDEPQAQLHVVKRETTDAPWGQPTSLGPVVNNWSGQAFPVISPDGLLLLFGDWWGGPSRPGGYGSADVWFTRRATKDAAWSEPVNLGPPISTAFSDLPGTPSIDGSTLFFASMRPGGQGAGDMWQAPILPVVDFDRDGKVALSDLTLLVESWGTDDPQRDIGPMPWGDGVVDAADLEVFMNYWGQEVHYLYDPRQAARPRPTDQSISDVEQTVSLGWMPGRYAAQHDVYVGTDPIAVEKADRSDTMGVYRGRQEGNEYALPEAVLPNQTFYWRIDEFGTDALLIKGQVWSVSVADYLIVDDMEASDAVWNRWLDGWADPNNGSFIDDTLTMVHTGEKSMYLFYDNNEAPISRVDRFWETPQDWTRRGVENLILWLHGSPDNMAEPVHIHLVDSAGNTAVIVHPDPAVLRSEGWRQWSIPLALATLMNVDLTAVQSMAIVIGDEATEESGMGELYIDDICLSPVSQ